MKRDVATRSLSIFYPQKNMKRDVATRSLSIFYPQKNMKRRCMQRLYWIG